MANLILLQVFSVFGTSQAGLGTQFAEVAPVWSTEVQTVLDTACIIETAVEGISWPVELNTGREHHIEICCRGSSRLGKSDQGSVRMTLLTSTRKKTKST
jgi:hypothetical protein